MINVMVVSNSWQWRSALAHEMNTRRGASLVAACGDLDEALDVLARQRVDVALVDEGLGDAPGLRLARIAAGRGYRVAIALVVFVPRPWIVEQGRAAGVRGFVNRADLAGGQAVADVVQALAAGRDVVTPGAAADTRAGAGLNTSEREIVRCLAEGMSTDQIAAHMSLGCQTVRNYIRRIGLKWGVSGRVQILAAHASRGAEVAAA